MAVLSTWLSLNCLHRKGETFHSFLSWLAARARGALQGLGSRRGQGHELSSPPGWMQARLTPAHPSDWADGIPEPLPLAEGRERTARVSCVRKTASGSSSQTCQLLSRRGARSPCVSLRQGPASRHCRQHLPHGRTDGRTDCQTRSAAGQHGALCMISCSLDGSTAA